jgi:hypothetical protein
MKTIAVAVLVAAAGVATSASAVDFTGPHAPANWSVVNTGTLAGTATPGTGVFSPTQLVLTGGNSTLGCTGGTYAVLGPCQVQATIGLAGIYSFSWSYLTSDGDGPAGDIFGVLVDSTRIQLSDPGGAVAQTGVRTFSANSSFGWFMNCTDCTGGTAMATVSNFNVAAVPEPETYGLMLAGLTVLGLVARRRRASLPRRHR